MTESKESDPTKVPKSPLFLPLQRLQACPRPRLLSLIVHVATGLVLAMLNAGMVIVPGVLATPEKSTTTPVTGATESVVAL